MNLFKTRFNNLNNEYLQNHIQNLNEMGHSKLGYKT